MKTGKIHLSLVIISAAALFSCCRSAKPEQDNLFHNYELTGSPEDNHSYRERIFRTVNNRTDINFSSFDGVDIIVKITAAEGEQIFIEFSSRITEGDFRVLLLTPRNEVLSLQDQSGSGSRKITPGEGISRIKMLGKEASGTFSLRITGPVELDFSR